LTDRDQPNGRGSDEIRRCEVLGDLGQIFEFPHDPARQEVIHDSLHPVELRRCDRADILGLEEEQTRRTGLVVEFTIERRQALSKVLST
jgi:hypothetical protein